VSVPNFEGLTHALYARPDRSAPPHPEALFSTSSVEDETQDAVIDRLADRRPDEDAGTAPSAHSRAYIAHLDNDALALLVARIVRQDQAALAELYRSQSARVYVVALRITQQVTCAEEVLQDTFWQVWRQAPRFDPQRGCAPAWVMTIARSRALDSVRAVVREPSGHRASVTEASAALTGPSAEDPLDVLQCLQRDSRLHAALAQLDPLRRQLISLAFFNEQTHGEIAAQMGMPLGTVKTHFRKTLAILRKALGREPGMHAGEASHDTA
jgi:RNA polymerase sigma factor (sigma-70 family)